ncbi:glycosyltransferase family 2 protein [Scytonema sp. PCC 10023]|uniref:glycosyltransferase family 2 protein n=1 Tax=Scytonema sp. PCC 10023 TaxID=1680591 RepID=UPI0039C6011F
MQELQTEKQQPIELPKLPEKPLVSILIANYNYAKYIGETLESVLSQTYPHFEAIVCDDGSKDNSCEVVESYANKDSRIKLVRQENGGVASALNTAYKHSSGEIICVLDADDLWIPSKLQKVVEAFQSDPKGGFVIDNLIEIDGNGKIIKSTPTFSELASGWRAPFAMQNGGFAYNIPPASALSIRRKVADLIFPMNEAFTRNADSLISYLAPLITVIVPVPEVLTKFRLHGSNITSSKSYVLKDFERDVSNWERTHQEQKQLLSRVYGKDVAERLTGLENSVKYLHFRYVAMRLKRVPRSDTRKAHQQLTAHTHFGYSLPERWFLPWAEYLPDALFAKMFDLVYGASPVKYFMKELLEGLIPPRYVLK